MQRRFARRIKRHRLASQIIITATTNSMADSSNPAWNDLDANGSWYNVPGQGNVWSPYDASDPSWDPYGNGYWMFTPGYGYIWASAYSWGYMPYQCGLWNWYDGFGWGWAPGARPASSRPNSTEMRKP